MALDSAAEFAQRIVDLGLGDFSSKFKDMGANSMGMFAFATTFNPAAPSDDAFNTDIVVPILGSSSHSKKLALRRLFIKSYTMATAELQRRCDPRATDTPRALPATERELRRKRLVDWIPGHDFSGTNDPSTQPVILAFSCVDTTAMRSIRWEECTSRQMESSNISVVKQWANDAGGKFKNVVGEAIDELIDTMARRSAALDMAGLCEYEASDAWTKTMIRKLREPTLPGYARVSLEQCYRADQEIWLRVSDKCRTGVARGRDRVLPVLAAIKEVMRDPPIILMMCPVPTQTSTGSSSFSSAKSAPPDVSGKMKRKLEEKDRQIEALQKKT